MSCCLSLFGQRPEGLANRETLDKNVSSPEGMSTEVDQITSMSRSNFTPVSQASLPVSLPDGLPRVSSYTFEKEVENRKRENKKEQDRKEIVNVYDDVSKPKKKENKKSFFWFMGKKRVNKWNDPEYRKRFADNVNNLGIEGVLPGEQKKGGKSWNFSLKGRTTFELSKRQSNYSVISPEEQAIIEAQNSTPSTLLRSAAQNSLSNEL